MESKMLKFILCLSLLFLNSFSYAGETADYVLVEKSKNLLTLFKNGKSMASYYVVFGSNPIGHKQQEGDNRTPEGRYILDTKNAKSSFTKSIHISYPNTADIANAKSRGVSPGGAIMIHGQKNGFGWASVAMQRINWTQGCIALNNEDMEQVWRSIVVPTTIEIKP